MKPHTFAQMVNEVRDLARQYGQVEQFRCRVADLLGKYIPVEHNSKGMPEQTEAQAVVVPEPDANSAGLVKVRSWIGAIGPVGAMVWVNPWDAMKAAGVRAIPADRVLVDGMVAVPMELLERLYSFVGDSPNMISAMQFQAEISDALRANQGVA